MGYSGNQPSGGGRDEPRPYDGAVAVAVAWRNDKMAHLFLKDHKRAMEGAWATSIVVVAEEPVPSYGSKSHVMRHRGQGR